jgi:hypothetical protein
LLWNFLVFGLSGRFDEYHARLTFKPTKRRAGAHGNKHGIDVGVSAMKQ